MNKNILDELRNEIIEGLERKIEEAEPNSSCHKIGAAALYSDGKIDALNEAIVLVDLTIYKYKHGIH